MNNTKNKRGIIIGLVVVVLIGIVVFLGTSLATPNAQIKVEKVEGLSFENATVKYDNKYSTFTVDVYNENKHTYTMKSIEITLEKAKNDTVTLTYEINRLESNEGRKIIIDKIDYNLNEYTKISYKINK